MRKKVMILFPEGNLPYSPSTLNLIRFFSEKFDVFVLANKFTEIEIIDSTFNYIPLGGITILLKYYSFLKLLKGVWRKLVSTKEIKQSPTIWEQQSYQQIAKSVRKVKPDIVIAVDLFALYCCEKLNVECIFFSLEIPSKSIFRKSLAYRNIKYVLIQDISRYDHLFADVAKKPAYFILPNSPVFKMPERRTHASRKLAYNGTIWSAFGPQFCLSFVTKYPEYELHLKGALHPENLIKVYFPYLIGAPQVFIETSYLSHADLVKYLQQFSIGFCFYHFEHPFIQENSFNYETGPSGKLFNYLSIGMPVICSNIRAFKMVAEAGAGILIQDYSPDSMRAAVEQILSNYQSFSDNALALAEQNCFQKKIQPIIESLTI